MKRIAILFAVLAVFLWVGSAMAITIDGNMADWGIPSLHGFNDGGAEGAGSAVSGYNNGVYYWEEEGVGTSSYGYSGWVEPGYGGTPYDIMAFYAKVDGASLYLGVITGFFPTEDHHMGDIGIDKDGDGIYEYGIDTTNGELFSGLTGDDWTAVAYTSPGVNDFSSSNPDDIMNGLRGAPTNTSTFTSTFYYGPAQLDGSTSLDLYSIEVQIALADIGWQDGDGATFHLTEWCGNDAANLKVNPVPEPATMLLFGTGLIGLAAIGRKKFLKQG